MSRYLLGDAEDTRVVLVEFDLQTDYRGRTKLLPFNVIVEGIHGASHYYDFNYCRRDDQIYYHLSGGGPLGEHVVPRGLWYWAAANYAARVTIAGPQDRLCHMPKRWRVRNARLRRLPRRFTQAKLFVGTADGETIWCDTCRDDLPDDNPCEHLWWCEEHAVWAGATPGACCTSRPAANEE